MSKKYGLFYLLHHLEHASSDEIQKTAKINQKQNKFIRTWRDIAKQQRADNLEKLKISLLNNVVNNYPFTGWQRSVKYEYCLHPLCTVGSTKFLGGRFNFGENINDELTAYPSLYIAEDKVTAAHEHLSQNIQEHPNKDELSSLELALCSSQDSRAEVSVCGFLSRIIDLTNKATLVDFVNIIRNFKLPKEINAWAKGAHFEQRDFSLIRTIDRLFESILAPDWREIPLMFNYPANCQEFGELVMLSGIDGILYKSKFTGKKCLAIFTSNFINNDSYIEISGNLPSGVIVSRLDKTNYKLSEYDYNKLVAHNNCHTAN